MDGTRVGRPRLAGAAGPHADVVDIGDVFRRSVTVVNGSPAGLRRLKNVRNVRNVRTGQDTVSSFHRWTPRSDAFATMR